MVEIGKSFPDRIVGESNDLANFMSMTGVQGAAGCTLLVFLLNYSYTCSLNEWNVTIMLLLNYSQEQKIKQIMSLGMTLFADIQNIQKVGIPIYLGKL